MTAKHIVDGLLVGGMIIVALLLIGALIALFGKRAAIAPVSAWSEASGRDLEDRLRKIQLETADIPAESTGSTYRTAPVGTIASDETRGGERRDARSTPGGLPMNSARGYASLRPNAGASAGPRLALPDSGSVSIPAPPQAQEAPSPALSPLAARFTSIDVPAPMAPDAPVSGARRPELPGEALDGRGRAGAGEFRPNPAQAWGTDTLPDASRARPSADLHAPAGDGASVPDPRNAPRPILPPSERLTSPASGGSEPLTQRLELPGATRQGPPLDIQAILRGETSPRAGTLGPGTPAAQAPRKPLFHTGPLPPSAAASAPIGAVPFDPSMLQVWEPVPPAPPPPTNAVLQFGDPMSSDDAGGARVSLNDRLVDLDATRLVEDFDLPDTGFETHVFSTAELTDAEPLGFPSFPPPGTAEVPSHQEGDTLARGAHPGQRPPIAPSAVRHGLVLAPQQLELVRGHMAELAALADVAWVSVVGAAGEDLLSLGDAGGADTLHLQVVGMLNTAIMEVQQLDLGDCSAVSVESPTAALLLSPLPGGAGLAVLLSNPVRLGLLRRQVRKPLAGLREALTESSVS